MHRYSPLHPIPKTLRLLFPLDVSDQVSDPYIITVKIIILYISIFIFLDSKLEDRLIARIPWLHSAPNVFLNSRTPLGFYRPNCIHWTSLSVLRFPSDVYRGKMYIDVPNNPTHPTHPTHPTSQQNAMHAVCACHRTQNDRWVTTPITH